MTRKELIKTAEELIQVDEKSVNEFAEKRDYLVDLINKKMSARSDIVEMVGENNIEMMADNHANHARFLESIFFNKSSETLVDTIIWVFRAYRSRNFSSTYWSALLNSWIEIYKAELSPECYKSIFPYYQWMQINIPSFNSLSEENLETPFSKH